MRTESKETALERMFDCFCKKVLRNKNYDLIRRQKRLEQYEIPIYELPWDAEPFACDVYFAGEVWVDMDDISVLVCNTSLAGALRRISPPLCRIILLSYFMSFSDRQIAEVLGMKRSTVQHQRSKALSQLHSLMESYYDREG